MSRDLFILLLAQFLTAFADNAILFTAVAMVLHSGNQAPWYIPVLQGAFIAGFVLLAPWVGPFADSRPKAWVLTLANGIKAAGAGLMLLGLDPLLSYALVGVGAAVYGPAKYGILPELVSHTQLVKANGWIESSTILAILSGTLVGALVADRSVSWALLMVILLFIVSGASALAIARTPPPGQWEPQALGRFLHVIGNFLTTPRARFSTLGVSLFWGSAAVLRVMVVAWAPAILFLVSTSDIAELTLYSAIGIAIGAVIVPRLITLENLRQARLAAYAMGIFVLALSQTGDLWAARGALLLVGLAGGMFVVPINAALQEIGHQSVGSGNAVAVQHFFENLAMLLTTGIYALAADWGAAPTTALIWLGALILVATFLVSWHLPKAEPVGNE